MSLAAEDLNPVFLRNFLTETVYVVPGETLFPDAPAPVAVQSLPTTAAVSAQEAKQDKTEEAAAPEPAGAAMPPDKFVITGENKKGVVVLVTLPDATFRTLPQLEFLKKILAAIGLGTNDVAFVNNVSGTTAVFEELTQELNVQYIISFASRIDTQLPHDKFTLYNPVVVGRAPIIFSQSLAVLDKDPEHKKLLWNALRQVFL
ncbi:hypothetical protein [Pontibacter beigongshangensis]|uniref:hypothetical protein n=1 Tax=Pontibacter beigongshangensis TaxID=2574733 RepID=UPI00188757E0|nr:hypothetical protein [Pontibacter beigongshangensis]